MFQQDCLGGGATVWLFSMSSCSSTLAASCMPLLTGTSYLAAGRACRQWLWKVDAASVRRTRSGRRSLSPMHASCSAACALRSEVVVWAVQALTCAAACCGKAWRVEVCSAAVIAHCITQTASDGCAQCIQFEKQGRKDSVRRKENISGRVRLGLVFACAWRVHGPKPCWPGKPWRGGGVAAACASAFC